MPRDLENSYEQLFSIGSNEEPGMYAVRFLSLSLLSGKVFTCFPDKPLSQPGRISNHKMRQAIELTAFGGAEGSLVSLRFYCGKRKQPLSCKSGKLLVRASRHYLHGKETHDYI